MTRGGRRPYDGVVMTTPVTVPYVRYSIESAHWWIGWALAALLAASGLDRTDLDGFSLASFTVGPDTAIGLTQHFGLTPRWLDHVPMGGEHTGTHFDAPIHWVTGRHLPDNAVDTLPTRHMVAPACVIDCAAEAAADADFLLTVAHVEAWEKTNGRIDAGAWVLLRTDWAKRTGRAFANLGDDGPHTPGPDAEVMRWLVAERGILGFGTETIGTDAGQAAHFTPPYPAHHYLHGAGRYGLQCLANLDRLPPRGAVIIAAPLKILQGSGSPLRILALVGPKVALHSQDAGKTSGTST
ncbi:cyclase family protein [Chelatococcus asaccharovorans]|uniref:cyclase family protein n=1 Tax=Chelatococcus asaccharovorans TaxID=28210 RepID=UPI00224C6560|nr:cyclase family protein [Chelatococcus asaccharovorans]CAH1648910.1 Kynurenine formamidase [Chelatococcus asaccharovorans]CAH1691155.1 Kynurenine formamidase [Chelatococcus asaccharovorans]